MSDQPSLCECGAPVLDGGCLGVYCSDKNCPVEKALVRQALSAMKSIATPETTLDREDSVTTRAESSRSQGLLDEIKELKRIAMRTARARDDYRADYFRVHSDYMDFKYPDSIPKDKALSPSEIGQHLKAHADAISGLMSLLAKMNVPVAYDPTGKTREPPHCPSCGCGLEKKEGG